MDELPRAQERTGVRCQVPGFSLTPGTSHLSSAIDRQIKMPRIGNSFGLKMPQIQTFSTNSRSYAILH